MAVTYIIAWLACSVGLCLFGFFVGRCARKMPIIDSRLPWTLSRDQILRGDDKQQRECEHLPGKPSWPDNLQ
jgi:hypothetical protein